MNKRPLPKYDFAMQKSMFSVQKDVQELEQTPHANFIANLQQSHYLVSGHGSPVTVFEHCYSGYKQMDTGM